MNPETNEYGLEAPGPGLRAWGHWGSRQYDGSAERFYELQEMGIEKALESLGIKELPPKVLTFSQEDLVDPDEESEDYDGDLPGFFEWAKNQSWDLWSAAISVKADLKWDFIPEEFGEDGELTAVVCYLLWANGSLNGKDPAEVYGDFDT
jgi:hypothetical protein